VTPNREFPSCPYCGQSLLPFTLPADGGWDGSVQFACFNDDCPYYVRGWTWMEEKFGVRSSYRHRVDPKTGAASPIAVWSSTALRDRIIEDDVVAASPDADVIPGSGPGSGGEGI
jgi:hypothetical protein